MNEKQVQTQSKELNEILEGLNESVTITKIELFDLILTTHFELEKLGTTGLTSKGSLVSSKIEKL
jgi:hypothetical protein